MSFNPVPEVKKGFWLLVVALTWLVYLFFEPIPALIAVGFMGSILFISHKEFK